MTGAGTARLTGVALVLMAAMSQPFGAALATTLFDALGPQGALSLRLILGALALLLIVRPSRPRSLSDVAVLLLFGVVLFGMNALFYESIARMPLGAAVTIEILGPLALSVLTDRRLVAWVWVVMGGAGVALLHSGALGHLDPAGSALALGAGMLWAAYIACSARAVARFRPVDGLAWAMVVAAVCSLPGAVHAGSALLSPQVLLIGAGVALASSVIPYSVEQLALRSITPATFAVLLSLTPAMATLAGWVVLDQPIGVLASLALCLVMGASAGAVLTSRDPRYARPTPVPTPAAG